MKPHVLVILILTILAALAQAQSSASYQMEQGTFNNGGNPSPELVSASYRVTLDAIGDGIAAVGLSSGSYEIDPGFPPTYAPPGEVHNLRFTSTTTLTWNPEPSAGSYSLYRGDRAGLPGSYGSKEQSGLTSPTATDGAVPSSGQCLIYLITASNRLNEEGTKGYTSSGIPRP
jgi:hypothetical protein